MLEGEEDGVAEPRPSDESHRYEAVPRGTLVDVEHQTGVKHLRGNNAWILFIYHFIFFLIAIFYFLF